MARFALIAVLLLTSCATTSFIDGLDSEDNPIGLVVGVVPFAVVLAIPLCIAWDTATFPVQYIAGFPPYGDRGVEEEGEGDSEVGDQGKAEGR